jgi:hypothetical protein
MKETTCKGAILAGALAREKNSSCCSRFSSNYSGNKHLLKAFQCTQGSKLRFYSTTNGLIQSQSFEKSKLGCNLHTFNCDVFNSTHWCTAQVAPLQAHWCDFRGGTFLQCRIKNHSKLKMILNQQKFHGKL